MKKKFSEFLKSNTTYPTELRDFVEWHKGVKYFGFWAIEVRDRKCVEKIGRYQKHLANRLHRGYVRQPHITLAASGLMSDDHFTADMILKQIELLEKKKLKPFRLKLSHVDSFTTCPYLRVYDSYSSLSTIRKVLNSASKEDDNPKHYTPHITLGFYDKAYKSSEIVKEFLQIQDDDMEFVVKEIVFAQYETKDLQGSYQVLYRVKL